MMRYLSRLLGNRITDKEGRRLGNLTDLVIIAEGGFPLVAGIVYRTGGPWRRVSRFIDWGRVRDWNDREIIVEGEGDGTIPQDKILLARDLLDKQIVDLEGYKIVRVSDIKLAQSGQELRVVGADVGLTAIMRRLGLSGVARWMKERAGTLWGDRTVPWELMSPLEPTPREIRLSLPYSEFREIHPSDMADIIEQLDPGQRGGIFVLLENPMAAEVLTQFMPAVRSSVAEALGVKRLSTLLDLVEPDEAADILGSLSREKADAVLGSMRVDRSVKVRELLGYPDDTAGGRMTPEFIAVRDDLSAQEAIDTLRESAPEAEMIYYAYVVDDEGRLKGVLSLRDLLREPPDRTVAELMNRDVISVGVTDDQEVVAEEITDHNLLALPVVDERNQLKGIVTVDDVIDVIREERAEDMAQLRGTPSLFGETGIVRQRLVSVALTLIVGLIGTVLMGLFETRFLAALGLVYFIPVLLRMSDGVSLWTRVTGIWELRGEEAATWDSLRSSAMEIPIAVLAAGGLCLLGFVSARLWGGGSSESLAVGLGLFVSVTVAGVLGMVIPFVSRRLRTEPSGGKGLIAKAIIIGTSMTIFLVVSLPLVGG